MEKRTVYWLSLFWILHLNVLAQESGNSTAQCDFSTDHGNTSSSGDLVPSDQSNSDTLPECVPLDEFNLRENIYDRCAPFLENRCYTQDYGVDFEKTRDELNFLNAALMGSSGKHVNRACWNVIRAFVCNYYYVGCNQRTRLAQGICRESCVEYVKNGSCAASFAWLENFAVSTGSSLVFTPDCDDPLWYVKTKSPMENITLDVEQCINISEVVENPVIPPTTEKPKSDSAPTDSGSGNGGGSVSVAIIGAIIAVVVLIVIIIIGAVFLVLGLYICQVKRQKKIIRHNMMYNMSEERRLSLNNYDQPQGSVVGGEYDTVGRFKLTPEDINLLSEELRSTLIPFKHVKITGDLGEGAFGCVYKGILTRETENGADEIGVAIKTIKNHSAYHELKGFLEESSIMCSFSHPNVLGMEGISLDPESQSPYLILPFMRNGDLKSYLKKKRCISHLVDVSYPEGLNHDIMVEMCYQISRGMEYLASRKLVHRDLAARNCMIDHDFSVKVADFGLTRDIYQKDYYRQSHRCQVPVKWMAPESLVDHISNEKTDVWSFGVTCWEVFSLGRVPYPTIANSEIVDYLVSGRRLQKPALCTDQLYEVMVLCWKDDPNCRPNFETLASTLQNLLPKTYFKRNSMYGSLTRSGDSYVEISSSDTTDSDTSFEQTIFTKGSSSFCRDTAHGEEVGHRGRSYNEQHESSRYTPSVPSPLLHSTSYDIPHSIPRESFLQNNLSCGSEASVYLSMAPVTPVRLMPLQECDSPDN